MVTILRVPDLGDRQQAGTRGVAIDQHGAGAALAQPAAELGAGETEVVAQHVEQRFVGIADIDRSLSAIDVQDIARHFTSCREREARGPPAFAMRHAPSASANRTAIGARTAPQGGAPGNRPKKWVHDACGGAGVPQSPG